MTAEDVVRAIWDRFPHTGVEGVLTFFDDDFEWRLPGEEVVVGHDGLRTYFAELTTADTRVEVHATEIRAVGDLVYVPGSIRLAAPGAFSDFQMFLVYNVVDGKVRWTDTYADATAALEALGTQPAG